MSEKRKFPRKLALDVVREILPHFRPATVQLIIAGSLRRGKEQVGDIEIVYVPIVENRPATAATLLVATLNEILHEQPLRIVAVTAAIQLIDPVIPTKPAPPAGPALPN